MEGTLAIIGVFFVPAAMIILIVWFRNNARTKRYKLQANLAAKALEKGQTISPDLFAEIEKKRHPLNTGIILIAAGVGISLFLLLIAIISGERDAMGGVPVGILPFLIGVAYVIIHLIEKKKAVNENAQ